jgi:hypothetical protein
MISDDIYSLLPEVYVAASIVRRPLHLRQNRGSSIFTICLRRKISHGNGYGVCFTFIDTTPGKYSLNDRIKARAEEKLQVQDHNRGEEIPTFVHGQPEKGNPQNSKAQTAQFDLLCNIPGFSIGGYVSRTYVCWFAMIFTI